MCLDIRNKKIYMRERGRDISNIAVINLKYNIEFLS